jgi:hypothetical protein
MSHDKIASHSNRPSFFSELRELAMKTAPPYRWISSVLRHLQMALELQLHKAFKPGRSVISFRMLVFVV